jgi:hypothetical protein
MEREVGGDQFPVLPSSVWVAGGGGIDRD